MNPFQMYNGPTGNKADTSCCGQSQKPAVFAPDKNTMQKAAQSITDITTKKPYWVTGICNTPAGIVPVVSTEWSRADRWGQIRSRVGAYRMTYSIKPGLYAAGKPDETSDVFVSANYKLSFDILRRELKGINGWILVLDTKGINVWCAAGKGTFGTAELVKRITAANLGSLVSHRRIIVPQLGATGVRASDIKNKTGFNVYFGPVEASDIKRYCTDNYRATPEMRQIQFGMIKRMILTPIELNQALKRFPLAGLIILVIFGLQPAGIIFKNAWFEGWPFLFLCLVSDSYRCFDHAPASTIHSRQVFRPERMAYRRRCHPASGCSDPCRRRIGVPESIGNGPFSATCRHTWRCNSPAQQHSPRSAA